MPATHFALAEDRAQARYLKRALAETGARLHMVVGTWPELIRQLSSSLLIAEPEDFWPKNLSAGAQKIEGAFWCSSLEISEEETLGCLDQELRRLLVAIGPGKKLELSRKTGLGQRAERHFSELSALHREMDYVLPSDLAQIDALLTTEIEQPLKKIVVYQQCVFSPFDPWQQALLEKVSAWSADESDQKLEKLLSSMLKGVNSIKGSSLNHLCTRLFENKAVRKPLDDSIQWLAVRDPLQEVEVAAGIIQSAMKADAKLRFSDFAILVHDTPDYSLYLQTTFSKCGIPLSGLNQSQPLRDLGKEVVFYFLYAMRKPAPLMALASFLTSPLLPWGMAEGHQMAQEVMNGSFKLPPPEGVGPAVGQLLGLLKRGAEKGNELFAAISLLSECLKTSAGVEVHVERALATIEALMPFLKKRGEIPWDELFRASSPASVKNDEAPDLNREGVAVFTEHEEPWGRVRRLIILGFSGGHYPMHPGVSPVFCEADRRDLRDKMGLPVETSNDFVLKRRALFKRQIGSAGEKAHFLIPRRDVTGGSLQVSETLTFIAQLFQKVEEPDDLILELERGADREQAIGIPVAKNATPISPRAPVISDLNFRRDLLGIYSRDDGSMYPLSPSRLETLMVSPLAWLFAGIGLEPREWGVESLDAATKGTLAHRVFEILFGPDTPLPSVSTIKKRVKTLLNQAIIEIAPFLLAPEWRVERAHLETEITLAAIRWGEFLSGIGGKVLGNEMWLKGNLDGFPLRGAADTLVGLPKGRVFVVDFKKSKSAKRRERMEKGFDSQASLYRVMLKTGDAGDKDNELGKVLKKGSDIGVLYYLMNDQVVLADTNGWIGTDLPGAYELGADISDNAMDLIRTRLKEVRKGKVRLNSEGDEDWFNRNAGITPYALENSPLIRLFMHPGEVEK